MIDVLLHNEPYRYIKMEELLENGEPDYRIQKFTNYSADTKTCIFVIITCKWKLPCKDFEYTKWLDPAGVPCYIKDERK